MSLSSKARRALGRWRFRAPGHRSSDEGDVDGMSYRDIVWENAMEAYQSSPDPQIEVTPYIAARLEATKQELLLKAERMKRERDRRMAERHRRVLVFAATAVLVLGSAGVTSALTGMTTGIPTVDRILDALRQRDSSNGENYSPGMSVPVPEDAQVRAGSSTARVSVRWGDGDRQEVEGSAFVSENNRICFASVLPGGDDIATFSGPGSCTDPEYLQERIARGQAVIAGVKALDALVVQGYVGEDVESLDVIGPFGPLHVELTNVWDTGLPGIGRLRIFAAARVVKAADGGTYAAVVDRGIVPMAYETKSHLRGGGVVTVPATLQP
jgi:hypothetical protein